MKRATDRTPPTFSYVNLKLASRCNLDCKYCYWFTDPSVLKTPPILLEEVEFSFLKKLEEHIMQYGLKSFSILFHGGEPTLFPKWRFLRLCEAMKAIQERTACQFHLMMTTNGTLIDSEWAILLRLFQVSVTISIDGPQVVHDTMRLDRRGNPTYDRVIQGIMTLRNQGIEPGFLAVCNPSIDPEIITKHFDEILEAKHFDILVPDSNHDFSPPSIASYYIKLFDLWLDRYSHKGVEIRYVKGMIKGLLGGDASLESIGYGPIETLIMLTDGTLEPLDVLRYGGQNKTRTDISILTHTFQDVTLHPVWLEAFHASLELHRTCQVCEFCNSCGGGYLPHRWSSVNRYDNPSVYCDDFKQVFEHIWKRIVPNIRVVSSQSNTPLANVLNCISG